MITPLDIQNKVFNKGFRGYSAAEVNEFLNTIIESYEQLYRQNIDTRDKITSMTDTINHYKALEETLKSTLVIAQQTGENIQKVAEEKAKAIVDEAYASSKKIIADAHDEVKSISNKYDEIKRNVDVYRARMTGLINSLLDILDNAASDKTLTELVGVNEALAQLEDNAGINADSTGELEKNDDDAVAGNNEQEEDF